MSKFESALDALHVASQAFHSTQNLDNSVIQAKTNMGLKLHRISPVSIDLTDLPYFYTPIKGIEQRSLLQKITEKN